MSWLLELLQRNATDPRARLELGAELCGRLLAARCPPDAKTLNALADLTVQWMAASNYKVSLAGMEVAAAGVARSPDLVAPFLLVQDRLNAIIERLGDAKPAVRESASDLLCQLADLGGTSLQSVLDRLSASLCHRQYLVRVHSMRLLGELLDRQPSVGVFIRALLPTYCKLLGDPNSEVREQAASSLVSAMRSLGPDVESTIRARQLVPESKLSQLSARFEESVRKGSEGSGAAARASRATLRKLQYQKASSVVNSRLDNDDQENFGTPRPANGKSAPVGSVAMRGSSMPAARRPVQVTAKGGAGRPPADPHRKMSAPALAAAANAGAVQEDDFRKAFTAFDKQKCDLFSARDVQKQIDSIKTTLTDTNIDWDRRFKALKTLRYVLHTAGDEYGEVIAGELNGMEAALLMSVKDLRSQICREACITVCYFCETYGMRMLRVCESLLSPLMALIQNSAKVMSTSGTLGCIWIIKYVQSPKLLNIVLEQLSSKSREIRRQVHEMILLVLTIWDGKVYEKQIQQVTNAIKAGLSDADPNARTAARNSFQQLEQVKPNQAQFLYQSLDPARQRILAGYVSQSSSSQSINSERDQHHAVPSRPGLSRLGARPQPFFSGRSASEINPSVVRTAQLTTPRGKAHVQSSGYGAVRKGSTPVRSALPPAARTPQQQQPLRASSVANPPATMSQPGSRSSSPTGARRQLVTPTSSSRIPRGPASREPSPRRYNAPMSARGSGEPSPGLITRAVKQFTLDDTFDDEPVVPASAELQQALRACDSTQASEKREGLKTIQNLVARGRLTNQQDTKRVTDAITKMLNDGNAKITGPLCECICEVVSRLGAQLTDWQYILLVRLLNKAAVEILPQSNAQVQSALRQMRQSLDNQLLLNNVFRYIQDPIQTPTLKVRKELLQFARDLLSGMDTADLSRPECRQAVNKLFQWMEDTKNSSITPAIECVIRKLFELNPADFSHLLNKFPNDWREFAHSMLRGGGGVNGTDGGAHNGNGHAASPAREPAAVSHSIGRMTEEFNEEMAVRQTVGAVHAAAAPSRHTPTRTVMSPVNSTLPSSASHNSSYQSSSFADVLESTFALGKDPIGQQNKLDQIIHTLADQTDGAESRREKLHALSLLVQMLNEGSLTLWEKNFKPLLLVAFDGVKHSDEKIRHKSLQALNRMVHAQAARFSEMSALTVLKVLDATVGAPSFVVQSAEECARTLASHLPAHVVIDALLPILHQGEADPRISSALKMVTSLVECVDVDVLPSLLPSVAPAAVQCFHAESAGIRKGSVFAIVAMVNRVGQEPIDPYLKGLVPNKLHLIQVYIQRAQSSSTSL